jgi:hypothetical protein
MKLIIPLSSLIYCHIIKSAHMAAYLRETGGWLASGVPLLNKIFCYLFRADFEKPLCWRALMSPASTVVRGGGRAPASKDSHLCWHKIAGGCCARQHKGVLAASKNRFWHSDFGNVLCANYANLNHKRWISIQ